MLRSFTRHMNETVFRGPDMEGGGGGNDDTITGTEGGDIGGHDDGHDDPPAPEEKLTVREQLKKSIAEVSEQDKDKPAPKAAKKGRFGERTVPDGQQPKAPEAATAAPESLPKEAKAAWESTPPEIQAAFVKREQDMAAGVEQLKQRYSQIDQAIAPHTDALRQMNATPGDAVNRMFLWFKALAGRPEQAFPELARAMGVDWGRLTPAQQQAAQQPGQGQQQPALEGQQQPAEIPPYVQELQNRYDQLVRYTQGIGDRFGGIEQNIQTQNEARTRENLSLWSKEKPYFEEVRQDMAQLIQTGVVPLRPDGQVDLDKAYENAIYLNPTVRAKVIAEQQQANQQVQSEAQRASTTAQQSQVTKARKAAVSIPAQGPPGAPLAGKQQKPQKLSVRDSLKAAVAELRDQ